MLRMIHTFGMHVYKQHFHYPCVLYISPLLSWSHVYTSANCSYKVTCCTIIFKCLNETRKMLSTSSTTPALLLGQETTMQITKLELLDKIFVFVFVLASLMNQGSLFSAKINRGLRYMF